MPKTIFEQIIDGSVPCHKVDEGDYHFAFLDINPAVTGHTLVVPKKPCKSLDKLSDEEYHGYMDGVRKVAKLLCERLEADGYNLVLAQGPIAGQTVLHAFFHILPRFADDRAQYRIMATVMEDSTPLRFHPLSEEEASDTLTRLKGVSAKSAPKKTNEDSDSWGLS